MHRHLRSFGTLLVTLIALTVLTACSSTGGSKATGDSDSKPSPTVAVEASIQPGDAIPVPAEDDVALTIKDAPNANSGKDLLLSVDQLDQMGTVKMNFNDSSATGKSSEFTGPLLSTVLEFAGFTTGSMIHSSAVNDYKIDIPWADAEKLPTVLATAQDGKRMTVANFGPLRVLYPQKGWGLDPADYNSKLIWQLVEISVS